jgi:3-oxosteroid 1-dehydrogenase
MTVPAAVDVVIIGSGGGSVPAALLCRDAGLEPLIIEKTDVFGGSTAISGGVLWIPNHPLQAPEGVADSAKLAREYMDAVIGPETKGSSRRRRDAFLNGGPRLIEYLASKGIPFIRCEGWSDYYDDMPGGCARGRSLMVPLFDATRLGKKWGSLLRRGPVALPLQGTEGWRLQIPYSFDGLRAAASIAWRVAWQRLRGSELLPVGMALQGRMLEAALKAEIPIIFGASVSELEFRDGRVGTVHVSVNGETRSIEARHGIIINAGGFSHNRHMRHRYMPKPWSPKWTNANPGDTGELIELAQTLGAATDALEEAIWLPSSEQPDGSLAWHVYDIAKPHCIIVDKLGTRFMNEGESYMAKGKAMYTHHAVPCYAIFDDNHRRKYMWSVTFPGKPPRDWIESGYMKVADTIHELAAACDIDSAGLESTVDRFNRFARVGKDDDFNRGARQYDRIFGDRRVKPNPALGPIEQGPFYAVKIVPGDVGTCGGIVTDEYARVLREDSSPIEGLYATGNSTASVMGGFYPGAGASIAGSFVFGWLAAEHIIAAAPTESPRRQTS